MIYTQAQRRNREHLREHMCMSRRASLDDHYVMT